jgi:hypothetical protein
LIKQRDVEQQISGMKKAASHFDPIIKDHEVWKYNGGQEAWSDHLSAIAELEKQKKHEN